MTPPSSRPTGRRTVAATLLAAAGLFGLLAACGDGSSSSASIPLTPEGKKGQALAQRSCASCHSTDGSRRTGPTWKDLAGSEVTLEGGETVLADDDYLRQSITDPRSQVVEGYPNVMAPFNGLSDEDLDQLVAYLRDLSVHTATATTEPEGDAEG